ncbi:MAG: MarP family serine protease [Gaiellaceae bacterium]
MTTLDWIALAGVVCSALLGLRRGLIMSALSLAGVIAGAMIGARIAPHLLGGGSRSPYTPLAALIGATLGAALLQTLGVLLGSMLRGSLRLTPLRALDSAGGLLLGAVAGLAIVWVLGAVALIVPGHNRLRQAAERSAVLQQLNQAVPPRRLLNALARIDPFPSIVAPGAPPAAPDPAVSRDATIGVAARSVVRVLGTACGIGVEGSGWVARPGLVVTAAHVIAGQKDTVVQAPGSATTLAARAVVFDPKNDVAVIRVDGLEVRPLPLADPRPGSPVAIVGYPNNGPLKATPGRIGRTAVVFSQDAYGRGPVARAITTLSGRIRHGDSGGPAIDASGAVETTVFAARIGSDSGYGTPSDVVRSDLGQAVGLVSTRDCSG